MKFEPYELAPYVLVYPNAYPFATELVNSLENGAKGVNYSIYDWEPWECRGMQASINPGLTARSEPDDIAFDYVKPFVDTYDAVLEDYLTRKNIKLTNPSVSNIACNYYDEGAYMGLHTDYDPSETEPPYYSLTINCYLNENYTGGDLVFNLSADSEKESIRYTPRSGDLVVIPASPPYLHKSEKITSGRKYFSHRVVTETEIPTWHMEKLDEIN